MSLSVPVLVMLAVLSLVGVGFYALLVLRNLIKALVAIQLLAKGAILALVLAGDLANNVNLGQSMALTVLVADTIVAVIGLALAVQIRKHFGTLDIKALTTLRR